MSKTCNRKLIANSLMEWTLASTTTFINADSNTVLIDKAKKLGIELPSPDLAAFETVYCEVDKYNLNGVKFSKSVAEKGLPTLIGKQLNWNHDGAHQICGYIIDAEIREDKIVITGILFKSLFTAEFDEVIKLFAEHKLFVSFELWNRNEKGESIVKDMGGGYRELTSFIGHGCALLLIDPSTGKPIPPACPKAQVFKLLASQTVIEEAEKIIDNAEIKDNSLIYAELATGEEPVCTKCKNCTCKKEGGEDNIMADEQLEVEEIEDDYTDGEIEEAKKITTEQRNALPDSDFALIQHVGGKKVRRFPINDPAHVRNALARLPQAKGLSDAERKSAMAKILKKAKALNMTELLKRHEKAFEEIEKEEGEITLPVGEVPVKLLDSEKKCKNCMTPLTTEQHGNEYCALCKTKIQAEEDAAKDLFCACETPTPVDGVCTTCTKKVKPESAQVTVPAPEVEQKSEEQAEVVVVPEVAHDVPAPEAVVEKKVVKYVKEEVETEIRIPSESGETVDKKKTCKYTTHFSDGTEEVSTEAETEITTYSRAQLDEAVDEIVAALPKEVTDCVKAQIKDGKKPAEAVKHCWAEYKKAHEKAMADVVGEKDKLIQDKKQELDSLNQELSALKVEKAKVEEQKAEPDLTVGNVEVKDNSEVKKMAKNVDNIIASKHDKK